MGGGSSRVEIKVRDRLCAVGTQAADPYPAAEEIAVLAAADPEVAPLAAGTFVDRGVGA